MDIILLANYRYSIKPTKLDDGWLVHGLNWANG